jgi:hypothetical protein
MMEYFEDKSFKEIFFNLTVTYPGGFIFIILGAWYLKYIMKNYDNKDIGVISPYYDGIVSSFFCIMIGIGIIIYKTFYE